MTLNNLQGINEDPKLKDGRNMKPLNLQFLLLFKNIFVRKHLRKM